MVWKEFQTELEIVWHQIVKLQLNQMLFELVHRCLSIGSPKTIASLINLGSRCLILNTGHDMYITCKTCTKFSIRLFTTFQTYIFDSTFWQEIPQTSTSGNVNRNVCYFFKKVQRVDCVWWKHFKINTEIYSMHLMVNGMMNSGQPATGNNDLRNVLIYSLNWNWNQNVIMKVRLLGKQW